jgi:hypothetical protein
MISEAKLSALGVSVLTGVGLELMLGNVFQDYVFALTYSVPATVVMGAVMALFASDNIKKGGDKPPPENTSKGN